MCEDFDVQLGRRLRRRRRLLGLSQAALGEACGVRFQQIQKYETASSRVSAAMLGRVARALGVPVAYFYEGLEPLLEAGPRRRRVAEREPPRPRCDTNVASTAA